VSVKVLVTGSREFYDYHMIYTALDEVYVSRPMSGMIVIHGAAKGADTIADKWAVTRPDVSVVRVPADWDNDGLKAGPIRNRRMLELNPDVVLAFFQPGAKNIGTSQMANMAKNDGFEVREFHATD
jgi:hypothetical protein